MTGFDGFGEGAVEFYDGLAVDNSKAYWTDQREVYETHIRAPMQALLAELEPEFGPGKIFRPYRDVRFSTDKTPYKTHCGATVGPFYLQIGADGLMAAGGYYQMTPDQVARFRTAVADDRRGDDLERTAGERPLRRHHDRRRDAQDAPTRRRPRPPPPGAAPAPVPVRLAPLAPGRRAARARGPPAGRHRVAGAPAALGVVGRPRRAG